MMFCGERLDTFKRILEHQPGARKLAESGYYVSSEIDATKFTIMCCKCKAECEIDTTKVEIEDLCPHLECCRIGDCDCDRNKITKLAPSLNVEIKLRSYYRPLSPPASPQMYTGVIGDISRLLDLIKREAY